MKSSILLFSVIGLLNVSLITPSQAAPDESFGRLFSTQNERNRLDNLRQNQQLKVITPQDKTQPEDSAEADSIELPDPITLQGYVKRNDGSKSTVWINRRPVQEESTVDSVEVGHLNNRGFSRKDASTDGVDVRIPANGKRVRLKAGQMYEPESDQIKELRIVEKAKRLNLEQTGVIDAGDEKSRD